jgi:hypothetical protein
VNNSIPFYRKLSWLIIWGLAFGFIEAAVVIYLRKLYYPDGFGFPAVFAHTDISVVELIREFTTLIIMWAVAEVSYRSLQAKLAVFMILFGIWDVFYYAVLRFFLKWPETFNTWDILFLIPSPWVGPVWAPLLVAVSLAISGVILLKKHEAGKKLQLNSKFWFFEAVMGLLIITSFLIPGQVVLKNTIPETYPWYLFLLGYLPGFGFFLYRANRAN